jgi:hypothetical protein
MGEYSNMFSRLPAITIEDGNDDLWIGVLESVRKIDHIDYRLKYKWVIWMESGGSQNVEYHTDYEITQSYNHLDAMSVGYKKNKSVEQLCIKRVFEF